jgi:hypothetical protein
MKKEKDDLCRCGHPRMPNHDTNCYGCDVAGCRCREFTPPGVIAWNESDYHNPGETGYPFQGI